MENHHVQWVNQLFRLGHGFNSKLLVYQRLSPIYLILYPKKKAYNLYISHHLGVTTHHLGMGQNPGT